jgi:cyclopropane fatty-acyl-phospholipid synthase-like methyltransferase
VVKKFNFFKMLRPYDQIANEWHSTPRGADYVKRVLGYVDMILKDLPAGARILDLGCGTGEPIANYMAQRGYQVVGVDESENMLKLAKTAVPNVEFVQSDMIDIQFSGSFAAAVAWDSIFHVDRKHHAAIFSKLSNALNPGGKLLLSTGGTGSEGFTSEMYGHEFFYSGHAPEVARGILESAGFEIELWEVDDPSSRGHIAVVAKKVSGSAFEEDNQ